MKNLLKLALFLITLSSVFNLNAQNNFQISTRVGYDLPTYNNNTPYIDYKGGLEFGASLDYYWSWFGLGLDYDHIKNKPESTYPTNLMSSVSTDYSLSEDRITRTFLGIGPNFKYQNSSGQFTAELNTRVGFSSIKGGRTLLTYNFPSVMPINFHAGYDEKNVFSSKIQMRFTYFFNQNWGINAGAYYLRHYDVEELTQGGISALYHPFTQSSNGFILSQDTPLHRDEACSHDISSIGLFAGLTYKFSKKDKTCGVCGGNHTPHCCNTCGCDVTVTAKDKFTAQVLANTDVVLVDLEGNIVQSGTTNSYGVVVFNNVDPNDYVVRGKLYDINLEETSIERLSFKDCIKSGATIQKEILYGDKNFILKGNAVECNTPKGLEGVYVTLKNTNKAEQKNTITNSDGTYIFHLNEAATYTLFGKKDNYISQIETVTTNGYNRNTTLFVKLEICLEYVECNTVMPLENIHFDLNKDVVRKDAKLELDKLVNFMRTYPLVKVELSSHTDSQGSDTYNEDLSQRRATNSAAYIVSQGINASRIIAKGYGEYRLLNRCANDVQCIDSEHEVNRRTEFKVLCPE